MLKAALAGAVLVLAGWAVAQTGAVSSPLPVLPAPAHGILAQAFWEDVTGQASFEQARQQRYTAYDKVFNRGYTHSVHWLRLSLPASSSPLGLRMTPAWLDEVTLYDPFDPRPPRTVGDLYPASLNDFHGLGLSLYLPASDAPRDIWLRLKTTSAHRLDAEVHPASEMDRVHGQALFWAALYSAVLVMILLVLLAVWVAQPDRVLGAFLVRHAMFTTFGTAYLGLHTLLLSSWLSPAVLDKMFSLSVVAGLPLGLFFDITLLSTYRPQRHLLLALKGLAVMGLGLWLMVLLGHEKEALELNAQMLSLAVLIVFVAAWSCKPDSSVEQLMSKRLMMAYYVLILGGVLSGLVSVLGWMKPAGWQLHILILHGLLTAFVMSVMLFMRGHRQLYQGQQLSWKLRKAEQEVELEQKRREEQSQFLHMLMHELKTPLSVVSMALGMGLEVSSNNGLTWQSYTSGNVALNASGALLVRTPIKQDSSYEGAETFTLSATNTGGRAGVGTGTIVDDGTGTVFKADGSEDTAAVKDDDRVVTVSSVRVNEASPTAVFTVNGAAGQLVSLALADGTAVLADYGMGLEVSSNNGLTWQVYNGGNVALNASGALLVRTPIKQDTEYEREETFTLSASNTGGRAGVGTGTIVDEGNGIIFKADGTQDPTAFKDDDRPVPPVVVVALPPPMPAPQPAPRATAPDIHVQVAVAEARSQSSSTPAATAATGSAASRNASQALDQLAERFERGSDPALYVLPAVRQTRSDAGDAGKPSTQIQSGQLWDMFSTVGSPLGASVQAPTLADQTLAELSEGQDPPVQVAAEEEAQDQAAAQRLAQLAELRAALAQDLEAKPLPKGTRQGFSSQLRSSSVQPLWMQSRSRTESS